MKEQSFEDFLLEKHASQYIGTKDCMIDDSNEWLQDLSIDEVIEYAEKWLKKRLEKERIKNYIPSDGEASIDF